VPLDAAVRYAHPGALLMSLVHLTGDTSLLSPDLRPDPRRLRDDSAGYTPAQRSAIEALAVDVLTAFSRGDGVLPPPPGDDTLAAMMNFCAGEDMPPEYVPMMLGELALNGEDAYGMQWRDKPSDEVLRSFHVLVVGAGVSGLCAAIRLQEAGIPYTVIEKNDTVGGTWLENTYPGCRVDIPNHFYSYSFEPNHDWPSFYSRRDDLHAYLESCSEKYAVRSHIRFRTEVVSAHYDEARGRWQVQLRTEGCDDEVVEVNAVISAVGQLNRPKVPSIKGLDRFGGPTFHSARWEHQHQLKGKRVAVVGTGASSMQFAPVLAQEVEQLTIFQRSPQWAFPSPEYFRTVSAEKQWLLKNVPYYDKWYRFTLFWRTGDGLHASLRRDPSWPHPERSLNALNDQQRVDLTAYIESQIGDDPELLAKAIPTYPPFGKRMLIDNGWFGMLTRDNVDLVVDPILEVTEDGVVTDSGDRYPADVLILATGFQSNKFLWPMEIVGRSGQTLSELWGEDPRAYLGITVPHFPNLFCLYGPNTNLAHGGSIIFHTECQVRFVLGCLRELLEGGLSSMECRQDVHDGYNERVDAAHQAMVWTHPGMSNWYKNSRGRVTSNSPWRLVDYWQMTVEPDPSEFVLR
jgi:4-hydroxyacetophenone monooxygenase